MNLPDDAPLPVPLADEDLARGEEMYALATELFPICRSLTGDGTRRTLRRLAGLLPGMKLHEVPSGTKAFDWTVPDEWNIEAAYIETQDGRRIVDFADNNLHVLGYSEPVDAWLSREELDAHLYSLPDIPDAIPYVTSYYKRRWGFCLTERQRRQLEPGKHRAVIRSRLAPGSLTYGELILPGERSDEVLLSTYVCHPSMANNELSGPVVTTALAQWLAALPNRRLTYRIVFVPETIGSIVYLSRHFEEMNRRCVAGFVVTCVGDDRAYSLLRSPSGETLADRVAQHVLKHRVGAFTEYDFLERGSDERQYCAPGIDLPVVSLMRSKYGTFSEYHTSADDLSLISPRGLAGGYRALRDCLLALEHEGRYRATMLCEPQLGKRGLYPTVSRVNSARTARDLANVLAFADGNRDLVQLAERIGRPVFELIPIVEQLMQHGLLERA